MTEIVTEPLTKKDFKEKYDLWGSEPSIYLPGPILHSDDWGVEWRKGVVNTYPDGFVWLNPLDFFLQNEAHFKRIPEELIDEYEPSDDELVITDEAIVETDKVAVDICDGLLLGYREIMPSWGTPQEQIYAWNHDNGEAVPEKPVSVWHGSLNWLECSPWLRYHATHHSSSLDACVDYLEAALDTKQLCVPCRSEAGVDVYKDDYRVVRSDCEWCGEDYAVRRRRQKPFGMVQ